MTPPKPPFELPDTDDPYVLLGVDPGASEDQIRRAYLRRIKVFKPDRFPAEFKRIRQAYDDLREHEAAFAALREILKNRLEHEVSARAEAPQPTDGDPEEANPPEVSTTANELDTVAPQVRPRNTAPTTQRLDRLTEDVHADLVADRRSEAAERMLTPDAELWAVHPNFASLLLEVACAVLWAVPELFDELAVRYGDILSEHDAEFRGGALLHLRTLAPQAPAWRQVTTSWPELQRFVELESSLRDAALVELGVALGQRAAADPRGYLELLERAARTAPDIVDHMANAAEAWGQRYEIRLVSSSREGEEGLGAPQAPLQAKSPEAMARTLVVRLRTHWRVWLHQLTHWLVSGLLAFQYARTSPPVSVVVGAGLFALLLAFARWAYSPTEGLYRKVLRPMAAVWLWHARQPVERLASALEHALEESKRPLDRLRADQLDDYPALLRNDRALAAFAATSRLTPVE